MNPSIIFNNRQCTFQTGQTILDVAKQNKIRIPTLCHLDTGGSKGSCNMCVVEIKREEDLVVSCTTKAKAGMEILSESPRGVAASNGSMSRKKKFSR